MIAWRLGKSKGACQLLHMELTSHNPPQMWVDISYDHKGPRIQVPAYKKFHRVLVRKPEPLRTERETDVGSVDKIYTLMSALRNFCSLAQEREKKNIRSWRGRQQIARDTFTEFGGELKQSPGVNNGYRCTRREDLQALRLWVDPKRQREANNPKVTLDADPLYRHTG